jgi:feruloyl esterase
MRRSLAFALLFIGASPLLAQGIPENSSSQVPAALQNFKIDNGTITVMKRDDAPIPGQAGKPPTSLPPRTIVKMVLSPAKGSNINVEVWLPDPANFKGRLIGIGNGGAAGHINEAVFPGPLNAGFIGVTTDMGTAPSADSGDGNPEVWKDFGFRATHLMTVVAKQLAQAYYGKQPEFSYFTGGSTGGQQAMQEAERYPADYDGIVAMIPAHCRTPLHAYFLWNYQILAKCPFSKEQEGNVIAAANEYMAPREVPAIAGKFISDPRCDDKDIEAVIALARKKDPSLTDAHADALRKLFGGPKSDSGARIFDGIPLGAAFAPATGNLYLFKWALGAKVNLKQVNFGADIDTYTKTLGPYLNAENPDLTAFEARGGKLIMVAGSADPVVPYFSSVDYYEKVVGKFGGSLDKVQSFFHFYIMPGMAHGGGPGLGIGSDPLRLVEDWREKGTVPQSIVGKKGDLSIPIYPYPAKIGWDPATSTYHPVDGPRGGVDPVDSHFLPPAAE